jgi:hypothetical protein
VPACPENFGSIALEEADERARVCRETLIVPRDRFYAESDGELVANDDGVQCVAQWRR